MNQYVETVRVNGFILKYFPVVAHLLMSGEEFTVSELMEVFSQGMTYSFLNRGLRIGVIERVEKGRFRLRHLPLEIKITRQLDPDEAEAERVMVRNGFTLVVE